jgi:hypothetical protein
MLQLAGSALYYSALLTMLQDLLTLGVLQGLVLPRHK